MKFLVVGAGAVGAATPLIALTALALRIHNRRLATPAAPNRLTGAR